MGVHTEHKWPTVPHLRFDNYWLNVRTLYRNIVSSFTSDVNVFLKPGVIAELMADEWQAITRVLEDTRLKPTLYSCDYGDLYRRYKNHTNFRGDTTDRMIDERKRMEASIKQFIEDVGKDALKMFDTDIVPDNNGRTIIQTHMAVDLLNYRNFEELELLESHTGAIKTRALWYTKYYNGKELSMIPFTQYFMRIFGDKEFFAPKDRDLRKSIVEIATKYNWNSLTTDGRVRINIEQLKNPYYVAVLKDMM